MKMSTTEHNRFSKSLSTFGKKVEVKYYQEEKSLDKILQDIMSIAFELDEDERREFALMMQLFSWQLLGNDD